MAQQGVRNAVETPVRRARSPRLPVAKTTTEPPSYERWRMTFTDPEEFLAFMRAYPTPQGVTLFLYRLKPKVDLSLIGLEETNIQKGPIADLPLWAVDAVAEKFGRGLYNVRVTDSNRPEGQKTGHSNLSVPHIDTGKGAGLRCAHAGTGSRRKYR